LQHRHLTEATVATQLQDLEELEKQSFRRFYDDGLLDVLLGLMMIGLSFGYSAQEWFGSEAVGLLVMVGIATVLVGGIKFARTRLLRRRLGRFTPGPRRRRKIGAVRLVLLASVVLGVAGFALGAVAPREGLSVAAVEVLFPLVWFLNATIVLGVAAHLLDVPRLALYGVLFGLVGPLLIWPDAIWDVRIPPLLAFGIPAVPIVAIGLWRLARFLEEYPVQPVADRTGAGDAAG
jgi:hypothetical protein